MKKLILSLTCILSFIALNTFAQETFTSYQACTPVDWPITNPSKFVTQFEEAAYCHCAQSGFPYDYCKNTLKMRGIYLRMIDMYHSKENSCNVQKDIPVDLCIQEWNSYCAYKSDTCRPK